MNINIIRRGEYQNDKVNIKMMRDYQSDKVNINVLKVNTNVQDVIMYVTLETTSVEFSEP